MRSSGCELVQLFLQISRQLIRKQLSAARVEVLQPLRTELVRLPVPALRDPVAVEKQAVARFQIKLMHSKRESWLNAYEWSGPIKPEQISTSACEKRWAMPRIQIRKSSRVRFQYADTQT